MVDPVRRSIVEDPAFQEVMEQNIGYLNTFNQIIDETQILFTPQPIFFEATTLWASALQQIYGGSDAQSTLDDLVDDLEAMTE